MAYQTYTTDALICGSYDRNTADRSYLLFTRDAGVVYASAKSVREERSKQRSALQDFSLVRVSLVKGKAGWKIGSIEAKQNFYFDAVDKAARGSVVSLFRFMRRFIGGEEVQTQLFVDLVAALTTVVEPLTHRTFVEVVVKVRLLERLGYVPANVVPESLEQVSVWELDTHYDAAEQVKLERLYAQAEKVSHL